MKKIKLFLMGILCLIFQIIHAQNQPIKKLKIGDKVPEIFFNKLLNDNRSSVKLSDLYKGRWLILDIWNVGCPSCIHDAPLLHELSNRMSDKVLIMPVCFDASKQYKFVLPTEQFFSLRKKLNKPIWPSIVIESEQIELFKQLFPIGFPSHIWIDEKGTYRGSTYAGSRITAESIDQVIKDRSIGILAQVVRFLKPGEPFLLPYKRDTSKISYGSIVTSYNDTITTAGFPYNKKDDPGVTRFSMVNNTVQSMYRSIFMDSISQEFSKRLVVEKATESFYKDDKDLYLLRGLERAKADRDNLFCYETILPETYSKDQAKEFIRLDLDRYFQIKSALENRKIRCLALVRTNRAQLAISGNKRPAGAEKDEPVDNDYYGITSPVLCGVLNFLLDDHIVFDEMNYNEKFDISMRPGKRNDVDAIKKELRSVGLDLIEKEYNLNMVVLKDLRK